MPDLVFEHPVHMPDVQAAVLGEYDRVFEGLDRDPRHATHLPRLATFHRWFDTAKWGFRPSYTYFGARRELMTAFVRFKLSSHDLGIELGPWKNKTARDLRTCDFCEQHALDDEYHMIYECPAMQPVRESYPLFFWRSPDMRRLFAHRRQKSLVKLVWDCLGHRRQMQESDKP